MQFKCEYAGCKKILGNQILTFWDGKYQWNVCSEQCLIRYLQHAEDEGIPLLRFQSSKNKLIEYLDKPRC
jgi:hypothetical protein